MARPRPTSPYLSVRSRARIDGGRSFGRAGSLRRIRIRRSRSRSRSRAAHRGVGRPVFLSRVASSARSAPEGGDYSNPHRWPVEVYIEGWNGKRLRPSLPSSCPSPPSAALLAGPHSPAASGRPQPTVFVPVRHQAAPAAHLRTSVLSLHLADGLPASRLALRPKPAAICHTLEPATTK